MITVNNKDNAVYKNMKLEDIIGFALPNGYFLIDQHSNYLVSFWSGDITCSVEELSEKDIDMNSTLEELLTAFNICNVSDIIKVFGDEEEFRLNLMW